ncbi:MAG: DUF11 domain-containing protein [Desulfobacterales bacterium]|nr:DUF11 domain-containing protein [Desulfobacterales bacterium]
MITTFKSILFFSILIFSISLISFLPEDTLGADIYVITKAPEQVESGEKVTFEITVINAGKDAVTDLDLINEIPPGLNYHNNLNGISLKWPLDNLMPGDKRTFQFTVDAVKSGTYINITDVYSKKIVITRDKTFVQVLASGSLSKEPENVLPQLTFTAYDTEDPIMPGSLITYVLVVKNEGSVTCRNVRLNNVIPQNMTYNFAVPAPTTIQGKLIQFPVIIALKPGIKYIYKVTCKAVKEGMGINTATVSCDGLKNRITVEERTRVSQ